VKCAASCAQQRAGDDPGVVAEQQAAEVEMIVSLSRTSKNTTAETVRASLRPKASTGSAPMKARSWRRTTASCRRSTPARWTGEGPPSATAQHRRSLRRRGPGADHPTLRSPCARPDRCVAPSRDRCSLPKERRPRVRSIPREHGHLSLSTIGVSRRYGWTVFRYTFGALVTRCAAPVAVVCDAAGRVAPDSGRVARSR
jgi:hypothetical protein